MNTTAPVLLASSLILAAGCTRTTTDQPPATPSYTFHFGRIDFDGVPQHILIRGHTQTGQAWIWHAQDMYWHPLPEHKQANN